MSYIKLKYVQFHQDNMKSTEMISFLKNAEEMLNKTEIVMTERTVYMVFMGANYDDFTKKMTTWCVFVNNTGQEINELHGELRFKHQNDNIKIATTIVDMNKAFMGELNQGEGILVNFNIPVKGMNESKQIPFHELQGRFENVRVTYTDITEGEGGE